MLFKSNLPPGKSIQNFILQEQINNKIIYINDIPGSIISNTKNKNGDNSLYERNSRN